jgi:DNA-binding MarR family transcriptional regulator
MADGLTGGGGSTDRPPTHANGNGRLHRLLRYSHIFSSAVREILEAKYLEEVTALPLTLPQFHLLKLIALNGKHQVGEVAEFLGVSSPAASKNIDKLVRLGLVERGADESDRRVTLLSASAKGRALIRSYEELKAERLIPVLERFEPGEIDQLAHLLQRFSVSLFEQEKADRDYCLRCAAYAQENCPIGHVQGNCPYDRIRKRNLLAEESGGELR